jgi:uncharacterized protein (TIGR03435 family)
LTIVGEADTTGVGHRTRAVQSQLGLKLEPKKRPVELIVIDVEIDADRKLAHVFPIAQKS